MTIRGKEAVAVARTIGELLDDLTPPLIPPASMIDAFA
jgi:hypothetical protein